MFTFSSCNWKCSFVSQFQFVGRDVLSLECDIVVHIYFHLGVEYTQRHWIDMDAETAIRWDYQVEKKGRSNKDKIK